MAFEPARKICLHFWPQKPSELLHEVNVTWGNLIRSFLSWLPNRTKNWVLDRNPPGWSREGRSWEKVKHKNVCLLFFLHYCCIGGVNLPGKLGMQRWWILIQQAHSIYKSSGEMSQQDGDVITTRKCIFKKMGPWLNCVHQGISQQKASLITFLKSLLHFQLYKNWVITVFNYLLAPTWLMSFTPIALWTVGEKRWSGSTL